MAELTQEVQWLAVYIFVTLYHMYLHVPLSSTLTCFSVNF